MANPKSSRPRLAWRRRAVVRTKSRLRNRC
jgi:hypothetical protein